MLRGVNPAGSKFQFHTGSIKGFAVLKVGRAPYLFQFHTGSIKGASPKPNVPDDNDFNSTLVRLKGTNPQRARIPTQRFQFHTGSIKGLFWRRKKVPLWAAKVIQNWVVKGLVCFLTVVGWQCSKINRQPTT